jgi:plastocyanin
VPGGGGKATTFTCTADFGSGDKPAPDGPVWACAIAADAAIPDNPSGPNQSQSAEKANLSDAKCDGVLLDRKAPTVSIDGAVSARVGDLVAFGAQASDATSGLAGSFDWSFGDNTAGATGESANHTFTAPGTYAVRVKATDAAGNQGTATKTITVSPRATTGGGSTGGGSTGGGSTAGGSTGGGSSAEVQVSAPHKLKARAKSLPVTVTTDAAGKASFALVRSGRVVARGSKAIGAGTASYRLKLPRKAKAGKYVLKVTFTPTGGNAHTKTIKVRLAGKATAATASASAAGRRARVSGAGAPVGLPNGAFHGTRKRSFTPRAKAA